MMSPRESVEMILNGGVADRIPFTMYENKIPQCRTERELRNRGLCIVQRMVPVYTTMMPHVAVKSIGFKEGGKNLVRTEYETPVGTLYTITEPAGFTFWTHKRLFGRSEDYKSLLFMVNDMQFEPSYELFAQAMEADGGDSFFRGFLGLEPMQSLISDYMSSETFCMQWYDNRDEILKVYQAIVEKRRQVYELCANSPAMAFNYGGNVTPEILGLDRFKEYYVPHYNEAAEVLHIKGKKIGVHFDANCRLIADEIAATKLDYIEAFTPAPDTDMTLAEARQKWQDKILWVNFPSSIHLETIEKIKETARELLGQMGNPKRFIMGITEDIPESLWRQNLLAISEVLMAYKM
jgi:hypothetical protein